MSGGPPRKLPRIMARVKQKQDLNVHSGPSVSRVKVEKERNSDSDALSHELSREKLVVRDGVVVAVQQIQHGGIVNGILGSSSSSGGRRVVIDTTAGVVNQDIPFYAENPLPGVADEIESYPCKFCPDQVFLTSYGLERHARQCHREQFAEIATYIQTIQEEWERREVERGRQRERVQMAKMRQESIAHAAIRNASLRMTGPGNELEVAAEEVLTEAAGPERFEACRICNLLINARHPTAMENHLRAHKKNDELRSQMLAEYGAEIVGKLTCHECHLVFTDENKLMVHYEHTHVRRRKFVCKWCGHLCASMTELNMHKSDVHAMPPSQSRADRAAMARLQNMRKLAQQHDNQRPPRSQATLGAAANYRSGGMRRERGGEDMVCRTSCDECGLHLVRPSLLIRHMLRVHSKEAFSCEVVTTGIPSFKIEVDRGRISWSCCDAKFPDRHDFLLHRRTEHLVDRLSLSMGVTGNEMQKEAESMTNTDRILQLASANLPLQPGTAAYTGRIVQAEDGTMQVVLPDGVDTSGEIFVVMMDDQENDEKGLQGQIDYSQSQPGPSNHNANEQQMHIQVPIDADDAVTLTQEQYDQLRAQYGDDLSNMQIMFVNEDELANHQMLEDEHGHHHLAEDNQSHSDHHDAIQLQKEDAGEGSEGRGGATTTGGGGSSSSSLMHQHPELTNEELFEP